MNEDKTADPRLPGYIVISPVHNEERHLEKTMRSMTAQTAQPIRWIVVNDGSTDRTPDIIDHYASRHPWIQRIDMPQHADRSFARKAQCFNRAIEMVRDVTCEVIANMDGDVSFEPDYYEFLLGQFAADPKLGVAGTPFSEDDGYDSSKDSFEGESHVSGQCQLFRRSCLEDVGGYVPHRAGGVDWIAVTTARMKGWKTRSFSERRFFHHRPLGTAGRSRLASTYSYGEKDYYLGGSNTWELCRVLYRMTKKPYLIDGLALGLGFLTASVRRIERPVSDELMRFHRREQMTKLKKIMRTVLSLRRPDTFRTSSDLNAVNNDSNATI